MRGALPPLPVVVPPWTAFLLNVCLRLRTLWSEAAPRHLVVCPLPVEEEEAEVCPRLVVGVWQQKLSLATVWQRAVTWNAEVAADHLSDLLAPTLQCLELTTRPLWNFSTVRARCWHITMVSEEAPRRLVGARLAGLAAPAAAGLQWSVSGTQPVESQTASNPAFAHRALLGCRPRLHHPGVVVQPPKWCSFQLDARCPQSTMVTQRWRALSGRQQLAPRPMELATAQLSVFPGTGRVWPEVSVAARRARVAAVDAGVLSEALRPWSIATGHQWITWAVW